MQKTIITFVTFLLAIFFTTALGYMPKAPNFSDTNSYVLMDADSGQILTQKEADERYSPASMTKIMTVYLAAEALAEGRIKLGDKVKVSKKAWKTGGSRMFIKVDTEVPVEDLLSGIIVASGNDATVALAEFLAGTEDSFVSQMNQTAEKIGMKNTHFMNASGLPDTQHYSSAQDIAILSQRLIEDYPETYVRFGDKWYTYNNIKQPNRNQLLWRDIGVDGIKTGHTDDAGYCLASSAKRNGMRLIAIVMGAPNERARAQVSEGLLNWGFNQFETHELYKAKKSLTEARTWYGKDKLTPLGITEDFYITVPKNKAQKLKALVKVNDKLEAPLVKGQPYGEISITLDNEEIATKPLVALQDNPKGSIWTRMRDGVGQMFSGLFSSST